MNQLKNMNKAAVMSNNQSNQFDRLSKAVEQVLARPIWTPNTTRHQQTELVEQLKKELNKVMMWLRPPDGEPCPNLISDLKTKRPEPVKLDLPLFWCLSAGIIMSLPSSVADFVPCDRLLQKAYLQSCMAAFERFDRLLQKVYCWLLFFPFLSSKKTCQTMRKSLQRKLKKLNPLRIIYVNCRKRKLRWVFSYKKRWIGWRSTRINCFDSSCSSIIFFLIKEEVH